MYVSAAYRGDANFGASPALESVALSIARAKRVISIAPYSVT